MDPKQQQSNTRATLQVPDSELGFENAWEFSVSNDVIEIPFQKPVLDYSYEIIQFSSISFSQQLIP